MAATRVSVPGSLNRAARRSSRLTTWVVVAALAGCAGVVELPAPKPAPVPETETGPEAGVSAAPAVVALADEASGHRAAGRFDQAAAALERALRIEPRNARLWHELAAVRLAGGDAQQAIQLATRSNSFAGDDPALEAANWRLMGRAWEQLGERDRAREAYERASGAG